MELVFRKLSPAESLAIQPGEIYLVPGAVEQRQRRDLAKFVLEKGASALLHGPGKPQRLLIDADPKLDDMLAASLAVRQMQHEETPAGCDAFANYTALLRQGSRPATIPLEMSLEGIFLAMRGSIQKPLTDPETGRQFVGDWTRLANVIFQAAARGADPFTTPLVGAEATAGTYALRTFNRGNVATTSAGDFAREFIFLAKDLDVYRQDVAAGEKWRVRLTGTAQPAQGLLLRQPKSLLFKYWTRSPCPPPLDGPYEFLAVSGGKGKWAFSTSSTSKLSLQPLAEQLHAAEKKLAPAQASHKPWLDDEPQHTMIVAPRGGSQLPDDVVLGIVRKYCRARAVERRWHVPAAVAGCLAVVLALGLFLARPWLSNGSKPSNSGNDPKEVAQLIKINDIHALCVGVSKYNALPGLPNAAKDAEALAVAFKKLKQTKGDLFKQITAEVITSDASRSNILRAITSLHDKGLTAYSLIIVAFSGHGDLEGRTKSYIFAPQDYDPSDRSSTGIFLDEVKRLLGNVPCPVILIFDTCHSGAVNENENDDPGSQRSLLDSIKESDRDANFPKGLVVMAACAGHQLATDADRWGHGALTLALLEGIEGKEARYQGRDKPLSPLPRPGPEGVITLHELNGYVKDRVEVLSSEFTSSKYHQQYAKTYHTRNISLKSIPIAVYK